MSLKPPPPAPLLPLFCVEEWSPQTFALAPLPPPPPPPAVNAPNSANGSFVAFARRGGEEAVVVVVEGLPQIDAEVVDEKGSC